MVAEVAPAPLLLLLLPLTAAPPFRGPIRGRLAIRTAGASAGFRSGGGGGRRAVVALDSPLVIRGAPFWFSFGASSPSPPMRATGFWEAGAAAVVVAADVADVADVADDDGVPDRKSVV